MKWVLLLFFVVLVGCGPETKQRAKWQYKVIRLDNSVHSTSLATTTAREDQVSDQSAGSFDLSDLDGIGADGWELVSAYIEPETVWPNVEIEIDYTARPPKVIPAKDGLRQPNVRAGKLVLIFKRPNQ